MARLSKCQGNCGCSYSKDAMELVNNRRYCSDCVDAAITRARYLDSLRKCVGGCGGRYPLDTMKKLTTSGKNYCPECIKKVKKEREDRANLYETIRVRFEMDAPSGFMMKQIKEYLERGYTLEGIRLTIEHVVKNEKNFQLKGTLGFVPYFYEKAKAEYIKNKRQVENVKKFNREKVQINEEIIDMSKREPIKPKLNKSREIFLD